VLCAVWTVEWVIEIINRKAKMTLTLIVLLCRVQTLSESAIEWVRGWLSDWLWLEGGANSLNPWCGQRRRNPWLTAWGVRRELSNCVNWGVSWLTAWIECLNPWLTAWGVSWVTVWGADWVSERLAHLSGEWSLEAVGRRESRDSEETVSWVRELSAWQLTREEETVRV
jgi:hypothetical protein